LPLFDSELDVPHVVDVVSRSFNSCSSRELPRSAALLELLPAAGTVPEVPFSGRVADDDVKGDVRGVSVSLATCVNKPLTMFGEDFLSALLTLVLSPNVASALPSSGLI
jgi:hypothetical protein